MATGERAVVVVTLAILIGGCASRQILDDGGSVSFGPSNAGSLLEPAALPPAGPGYRVPAVWRQRGLAYGTDELVGLVVHVGEEIARAEPGRAVAVADLSMRDGGPSAWHRSHQTGRDVDLIFFARDPEGRPVEVEAMRRFGPDGRSLPEQGLDGKPLPTLVFDTAANWRLIRSLLGNPIAEVQYAFISDDLKQLVLDHAEASGDDQALIAAASYLLQQPGDSLVHDDHMHVRILCTARDRDRGCQDAGSTHWRKKEWKYARRGAGQSPPPIATAALR